MLAVGQVHLMLASQPLCIWVGLTQNFKDEDIATGKGEMNRSSPGLYFALTLVLCWLRIGAETAVKRKEDRLNQEFLPPVWLSYSF